MAFRIGEYVICGELLNTSPYSTHGALQLAGLDYATSIQLTGDCDPDLKGRHFRFEAVPDPSQCAKTKLKELRKAGRELAMMQVGPTGTMTAAGWVKAFDCSVEEFCRRSKLGEPPPLRWERHLYLEWYSQNGRVVLELAGPIIEVFEDGEWKPLPPSTPSPAELGIDPNERQGGGGLEITAITDTGEVTRIRPEDDMALPKLKPENEAEALQVQLDMQSEDIERAIRGEEPECEELLGARMMDHVIDNDLGELIVDIFEEPHRFPDPDRLNDEQAESVFKSILMQLAMCGVAFYVCKHFTPREAYRLLIDKVMKEERIFRPLKKAGGAMCYMTSEYCQKCEEEAEADYEANKEKYEEAAREYKEMNEEDRPF